MNSNNNNGVIAMWFCFGPDAECLIESVKAFRRTFPDNKVCLCDDPKNPLSDENIKYINPDYYELRDWNSGGNLNGWEAVQNILIFQDRMHKLFPGYKGALKIDSDTLVLDSSWINLDAPICGIDLGTATFFAGMARYLRADVPYKILEFIDNKFLWHNNKVPEDQVIGNCAMLLFGKECDRRDWFSVAMSYSYINPETNKRFNKVVTFGNRDEIKEGSSCDKRTIAALHMANYSKKFIDMNPSV